MNAPFTPFLTGTATRRRLLGGIGGGAGLLLLGRAGTPHAAAQATPAVERITLGDALGQLEPAAIWSHFYDITQIPRPSHHEEQISAFLAAFGDGLSLETEVDTAGNVIIRKPASPGLEDRQGVIFQSHMDMVGVNAPGSDHVFETDPINAYIEGGWVYADGTTLGADDGIGIAIIMTLLEADGISHGPLEALFTVNEEDGFTGANALQPGVLRGSMLINVDSEEEGGFTIGSAGGVNIDAALDYQEEAAPAGSTGVMLEITGLQGGHSGIDIGRGRGNAIKLLACLLNTLEGRYDLRLASASGGDRYNAIPREARAVIVLPESESASLAADVAAYAATVQQELAATEPELEVTTTPVDLPPRVMALDAQRRVIDALNGCPNGVIRMSDAIPGLVETSSNLGLLEIADGGFSAGFLVRSAVDSERDDVQATIESVLALAGIDVNANGAYSGWQPDPDSPLLEVMQSTYRDLFGKEASLMAVHAGLETSAFGTTYPGMQMISVGPTMQNVHSPDERLEIESVGKVYDLLVAFLERVPSADGQ